MLTHSSMYSFSLPSYTLSHWLQKTPVLKDIDEDMQLEAYVRSGDYFEMLATKLDEISEQLQKYDLSNSQELSRISNSLLYLHERYTITKKES